MPQVIFHEERCKGCEICMQVCPVKIITAADHINAMGFHPAAVTEQEKCKGCALCARMCPDLVIEVFKEVAEDE